VHLSVASFLGKLLVLPTNVRLDWKEIARCKHSSLFGLVISNEGNFFITLTPGLLLAHQPRVEGEDIGEKKNKKSQVLIDYYGPNKHRECAYQQAPITILVNCL
jgi:hypothetical protein